MVSAIFGTHFEELSDEDRDSVAHRPLGIREQTVTDDRGRRRFHGAFTGGFSAGYFNTVGSKEGWTPSHFTSSIESRASQSKLVVEDFMDEEDLNEFGISTRRVHLSDKIERKDQRNSSFAWDRESKSDFESALIEQLRPVRDSIGIQLMKKMGWKEGQGIGQKMSRRELEKHRGFEASLNKKKHMYDDLSVKEAEEIAPNFQFAPDDVTPDFLTEYNGIHGLGYVPLQQSNVLTQNYGLKSSALKFTDKSSGIRGQAFGVGAFEEDDDVVYTNYDFSQYDFSIGNETMSRKSSQQLADSSFIMAEKTQRSRPFFDPPRLQMGIQIFHKSFKMNIASLPASLKLLREKLNHAQRAQFLGEADINTVKELILNKDRDRLQSCRNDKKFDAVTSDFDENIFEEEPMKQARFKRFIHYLKRGLTMDRPAEMTTAEWDREFAEFRNNLPSNLQSRLVNVQWKQKPLVQTAFTAPLGQLLKTKFIHSVDSEMKKASVKDDDRLSAVKMKMFGDFTREIHEWHPSKQMMKRFNVPDPYPTSTVVGVPYFQKKDKSETLLNLGLPTISVSLDNRNELTQSHAQHDISEITATSSEIVDKQASSTGQLLIEKPPEEFLRTIFDQAETDSESSIDTEYTKINSDTNDKPSTSGSASIKKDEKIFKTVMDIVSSDEEYGPSLPPDNFSLTEKYVVPTLQPSSNYREEKIMKEAYKHHKKLRRRKDRNERNHRCSGNK